MISEISSEKPSGFEVSRLAWGSLFTAIRKMPSLILSSMGAVAVVTFLQLKTLAFVPLNMHSQSPSVNALLAAQSIIESSLLALVLAPVAVAVHRLILLGETTPGIISLTPSHTRKFVIWMIIFEVCVQLLRLANFTPPLLRGLISLASVSFILLVTIRLILLFPAIAIDAPIPDWKDRLEKSWRQTRGNFWLIFRSEFIAFLPFIILLIIMMVALIRQTYVHRDPSYVITALTSSPLGLLVTFSNAVYEPIGVALAAAVASWIYKWVIASGKSVQNM